MPGAKGADGRWRRREIHLPDLLPPKGLWPTNWASQGRRGAGENPPSNYIRITAAGMYRNWYEHRAVADLMLRLNQISAGVDGVPAELPRSWEVHHMDGNRHHNCPFNLLISPPELHPKPTSSSRGQARHPYTGKFLSKEEMEKLMDSGMIEDTRVPF